MVCLVLYGHWHNLCPCDILPSPSAILTHPVSVWFTLYARILKFAFWVKGRYLRTVRAEEKEDEDAEDTASTASGISGRGMHASGGLRDFAVHSLGIGGDGAGSLGGTASSRYFRAASAGGLGSVSGGSVLGESIEIVDTKTQFPVDANGMGLGDSAEVLHIASAERRSDQVSTNHTYTGKDVCCLQRVWAGEMEILS